MTTLPCRLHRSLLLHQLPAGRRDEPRPRGETAFSQRDIAHNVNITAVWTADDAQPERHIDWARRFRDALEPFARHRVYVNFLGDEGAAHIRAAYGDGNYERLVALKEAWDPTNFLRSNHNIKPPGAKGSVARPWGGQSGPAEEPVRQTGELRAGALPLIQMRWKYAKVPLSSS